MIPFRFYSKVVDDINIDDLKQDVNLTRQKILSDGILVDESRLTCWMSDVDTTLEYSDKIMAPIKLSPLVKKIQSTIFNKFGIYYDSVLVNYYKDNTIGMRYHSDPLGDGKWEPDFMIVSIGCPRKLIFREIKKYDNKYPFEMQNGDCVHMFDNCQDLYQHCLKKEKVNKGHRISLVFKRLVQ